MFSGGAAERTLPECYPESDPRAVTAPRASDARTVLARKGPCNNRARVEALMRITRREALVLYSTPLLTAARLSVAITMLVLLAAANLHAQDPLAILPNNYRVVLENETVRVIHVVYKPYEKLPVHDHPKAPTIYVYLSDSGPVRFRHEEEHAFELVRKPLKAGTFRVSPGRVEVHEVENLGGVASEFLRIELRRIPLGLQGLSFRDVKRVNLIGNSVSEEFRCPAFLIQRIVAASDRPVVVTHIDKPSLIVAFAPTVVRLQDSDSTGDVLQPGDVRWLAPHGRMEVRRQGLSPAHLLRIVFDDLSSSHQ